jgi:hypothetical protein
MIKKHLIIVLLPIICSCSQGSYSKAEDAQDAGREFIRASLDGNYNKALFYLYRDSSDTNVMLLDKQKKNYNQLPEEVKVNYKEASIRALRVEPVNDSVVNYMYTNSYKPEDTTTIKIVRVNNEWLVDLKEIH